MKRKGFIFLGFIITIIVAFLLLTKTRTEEYKFPKTPSLERSPQKEENMEKVEIITKDGVIIKGIWKKSRGEKAVLLLHMMPSTKESWKDFAELLDENGFSSLAIDLRGHGESIKTKDDKNLDYRYFSDKEHQESILDVEAASEFLKENNFSLANQYLVGASIGANLSLEFLSQNPEIKKAVLLSPGLDYRGIKTEPFIEKLKKDQKILASASEDDYYSFNSVKKLSQLAKEKGIEFETLFYKKAGHGTDIFGKELPDLAEEILKFLKK